MTGLNALVAGMVARLLAGEALDLPVPLPAPRTRQSRRLRAREEPLVAGVDAIVADLAARLLAGEPLELPFPVPDPRLRAVESDLADPAAGELRNAVEELVAYGGTLVLTALPGGPVTWALEPWGVAGEVDEDDEADETSASADLPAEASVPGPRRRRVPIEMLAERVAVWLAEQPCPASTREVEDGVAGRREYVREALADLFERGEVEVEPGPRGARLWRTAAGEENAS